MNILKKLRSAFPDLGNYVKDLLLVFILYFLSAKLGIYIYFEFATSPALIWPPVGLAVALMYYKGNRVWPAIFLAQYFSLITRFPMLTASIISVAYTLQAVVALSVMRRWKFEPSLYKLRNTLILSGIAFFVTTIEPLSVTLIRMRLSEPITEPLLYFGRAWGAGIFSVLVITPFIFTWVQAKKLSYSRNKKLEILLGYIVLSAVVYVLFWTPYAKFLGISAVFILPAVLIWFALSMEIRWTTLALIFSSIFGIMGSIVARPSPAPLNEQLLASQIYLGLVAAIFLVFAAVVEERRTAYRSLEESYDSTRHSDKLKSEFIAILAHELRNPLASIVSSTDLLQLGSETVDRNKAIESIKINSKTMSRLLDDLLDTVRLSQSKFTLKKEKVNLKEVVEQAVASKKILIEKYHHHLTVIMPKEEVTLLVDPVRFKQIIINLMGNACKYTKPGGRIELSVAVQDQWVIAKVTDNGIGIDADAIQHIFKPFKQSESALKHDGSGLGIGLFLTKALVDMHGGKIEVSSEGPDRGSTFTVYLPIVSDISHGVSTNTNRAQGVDGDMRKSGFRVLVIDDNEDVANALLELLTYHGHTVEAMYSGKHALESLDRFEPEFIFLDIGMPEMDGYEIARTVRARGWQGKMVALSGYGQATDRIKSKDAGFDDHLIKPVGIEKILEILTLE